MNGEQRKEYIIDRLLRRIIAFIVVFALVVPVISPGVFAASSASITGGDEVEGGDTFTVAVTFSGGDVGRVDAQMLYDTDSLSYISGGTSKGDTGYIQLKKAGTEGAIVFNIKFQAISEGSTELQVTTNEMYDLDEASMDTPTAYKTISIQGDAEEEELITEPPDEEEPEEPSSLVGVDEKTEESEEPNTDILLILLAIAVVLFIIIVIISAVIAKKKRRKKAAMERKQRMRDNRYGYDEEPRIGRSGKPLDTQELNRWEITEDDYKDIDKW